MEAFRPIGRLAFLFDGFLAPLEQDPVEGGVILAIAGKLFDLDAKI